MAAPLVKSSFNPRICRNCNVFVILYKSRTAWNSSKVGFVRIIFAVFPRRLIPWPRFATASGGDRNCWQHRHDRVNRKKWKRRGDSPGTRSDPDGTSPSGTAPWLVLTGVIGCDQLYEMEMRPGTPRSLGIGVNGQRSGHSSNRSRNLRKPL